MRRLDVIGHTFGQLTVLADAESRQYCGKPFRYVHARCTCGAESTVSLNSLRKGDTTSCGCFHREVVGDMARTHGESRTRLYRIWKGMHTRCNTPTASGYSYYGGRGITVCVEWGDFPPFKQWAEANGYSDELTIDRENGDRDYTPENCRWATKSEQAFNRKPKGSYV